MFMSRVLDFQKTRYARFMNHRVPSNRRYQPTEYEHAANCATHAFWILPSILGSSILYVLSDDHWETISAWIYGFGLSSLFIVSTIFHTISWKKRHLRTVEHCLHMFDRMVIYFFIAASYAPWLNLRELGPWASHMRWIIWIMASIGTVYVFFFHERYKLVELVCYVIMGFFPALVILSMCLSLYLVCVKAPGLAPLGEEGCQTRQTQSCCREKGQDERRRMHDAGGSPRLVLRMRTKGRRKGA
ncbi:monocyte to macrophage differentiation factor 2 isoform X3 [Struthio camelus]|uniref:monocyte to macrophage differentiation factor 2 isoform X3 n=1 Tax=Struthio camelus TaxID=8801 RepID=UPI0036042124